MFGVAKNSRTTLRAYFSGRLCVIEKMLYIAICEESIGVKPFFLVHCLVDTHSAYLVSVFVFLLKKSLQLGIDFNHINSDI